MFIILFLLKSIETFKCVYLFSVVGEFLDKIKEETIDVIVGRSRAINCPLHASSQNVKYHWFYKQADIPQPLPSANNHFVTENGTLYFPTLLESDVKFIEENGGIFCQQQATVEGQDMRARQSHRIKLKMTSKGEHVLTKSVARVATQWVDQTICQCIILTH